MLGRLTGNEKDDKQVNGFIGKDLSITGKMRFDGLVRIDGKFNGDIDSSSGTLIIGDEAVVDANIKVDTTLITGEVKGEIEATSKIELRKPCKLYGNIKTPNLIIGEGVIFEGNCEMGDLKEAVVVAPLPFSKEG
ncbi:MAG: polymer-forming cytoskeletal protein [Thermodesulfobacteriota bacterium]